MVLESPLVLTALKAGMLESSTAKHTCLFTCLFNTTISPLDRGGELSIPSDRLKKKNQCPPVNR